MTTKSVLRAEDMLAAFLFDDAALIFLNDDRGEQYLGFFSHLSGVDRMALARELRDDGFDVDGNSVVLVPRPPAFPAALPTGAIIGLYGLQVRRPAAMEGVPQLDADGTPKH